MNSDPSSVSDAVAPAVGAADPSQKSPLDLLEDILNDLPAGGPGGDPGAAAAAPGSVDPTQQAAATPPADEAAIKADIAQKIEVQNQVDQVDLEKKLAELKTLTQSSQYQDIAQEDKSEAEKAVQTAHDQAKYQIRQLEHTKI